MSTIEIAPLSKGRPIVDLAFASTVKLDGSLGFAFNLTLTGNATLANPTNLVPGAIYALTVTQDETGAWVLSFGSDYQWPAVAPFNIIQPPAQSSDAGAVDAYLFLSDGISLRYIASSKESRNPILAPSGLTGTPVASGANLSWTNNDPNQNATNIDMFTAGSWGVIATVAAGVSTYHDDESPGTYTYRVRGMVDAMSSEGSNSVNVTVTGL